MNSKRAAIGFIPLILMSAIFGAYLAVVLGAPGSSSPPGTGIYSLPPTQSMTATSKGWQFTITETQAETSIGVTANLTYTANENVTYAFGAPLVMIQIQAQNGTIVWSEVTTELLRLQNMTHGETFSDSDQVPTAQLQLGQSYSLLVYPQVSGNGFSGQDVRVSFSFSPLAGNVSIPATTSSASASKSN